MSTRKKVVKPIAGVNEAPVDGVSPAKIAETAEPPVRTLHVNGKAIPQHVVHLVAYEATDEGIAEKNAKRLDSQGRPHSGVQVLVNEGFDQKIMRRAQADEPWDTADPLLDLKNQYAEPGFVYRGLGPKVIQKRGMRGWEAVVDKKSGEIPRAGNLLLGRMPIERAERRNQKFRDEGNAAAASAAGRFQTDQERAVHDGGSGDVRILRAGETLSDDGDPTRRVSIGVRSSRDKRADVAA